MKWMKAFLQDLIWPCIIFGQSQSMIFRFRRSGGFLSFSFDTSSSLDSVPFWSFNINANLFGVHKVPDNIDFVPTDCDSLTVFLNSFSEQTGKIRVWSKPSSNVWSMRHHIGIVLSIYSYWKPYAGEKYRNLNLCWLEESENDYESSYISFLSYAAKRNTSDMMKFILL